MQSVFLDGLMIILLTGVIVFSYQLNAQLKTLRKTGAELTPTIKHLSSLILQSQQHVDLIKRTYEDVNKSLEVTIPQAQNLRDDLIMLIERSDKTASLLENVNSIARRLQTDVSQAATKAKEIQKTAEKDLEKIKDHTTRLETLKNTEVFRPFLHKKGPAFEQKSVYEPRERYEPRALFEKESYERKSNESPSYERSQQDETTSRAYDTSELLRSLKSLR
ncbi:MAG TPA: DUF6468 domain-containing protein [Alphaproteobacteria bacterium]|nr:DUF6468 domain-containing protein [Alphaproteobacteria bacterium]